MQDRMVIQIKIIMQKKTIIKKKMTAQVIL